MAADYSALEELHALLAQTMREELEYYRKEEIPVPAADKAVIVKFLKDNAVVATPKTREELDDLREQFTKGTRGSRLGAIRAAIEGDLEIGDGLTVKLN